MPPLLSTFLTPRYRALLNPSVPIVFLHIFNDLRPFPRDRRFNNHPLRSIEISQCPDKSGCKFVVAIGSVIIYHDQASDYLRPCGTKNSQPTTEILEIAGNDQSRKIVISVEHELGFGAYLLADLGDGWLESVLGVDVVWSFFLDHKAPYLVAELC